jgi:hypothetical protein
MKFITIDKDRWINVARIHEVRLEKLTDTLDGETNVVWALGIELHDGLKVFEFETEEAARAKLNGILHQVKR